MTPASIRQFPESLPDGHFATPLLIATLAILQPPRTSSVTYGFKNINRAVRFPPQWPAYSPSR